jgi:hypothetical protein
MSAADVLDVIYTLNLERADDLDRLTILTGNAKDETPSARLLLDRDLGLAPEEVSAMNPTGASEVVPVRTLSMQEWASRVMSA